MKKLQSMNFAKSFIIDGADHSGASVNQKMLLNWNSTKAEDFLLTLKQILTSRTDIDSGRRVIEFTNIEAQTICQSIIEASAANRAPIQGSLLDILSIAIFGAFSYINNDEVVLSY